MSVKTSKVLSWYQSKADKRILRCHKIGPPNVHPQEPRQEEDNLSNERLRKDYQVGTTPYENESLLFNNRSAKLNCLDEAHTKFGVLLNSIFHRKGEINANLDKEGDGRSVVCIGKGERACVMVTDLARGKALSQLAKKVPIIKRREEGLEYPCDYNQRTVEQSPWCPFRVADCRLHDVWLLRGHT